jgi:hypothetical protein
MTTMYGICEDLGNYGDMLGALSPAFGRGIPQHKEARLVNKNEEGSSLNKQVMDELAKLGSKLAGLNPRDVCIWGNG